MLCIVYGCSAYQEFSFPLDELWLSRSFYRQLDDKQYKASLKNVYCVPFIKQRRSSINLFLFRNKKKIKEHNISLERVSLMSSVLFHFFYFFFRFLYFLFPKVYLPLFCQLERKKTYPYISCRSLLSDTSMKTSFM